MYLVLCWLVTHNKFEAGWPWCGMTGRSSSCGTTGKQDPSWALLSSRQKWGNERMEPGRPPVTERPGQAHRAQPLRTSSAAEFAFTMNTVTCPAPTMCRPAFGRAQSNKQKVLNCHLELHRGSFSFLFLSKWYNKQ